MSLKKNKCLLSLWLAWLILLFPQLYSWESWESRWNYQNNKRKLIFMSEKEKYSRSPDFQVLLKKHGEGHVTHIWDHGKVEGVSHSRFMYTSFLRTNINGCLVLGPKSGSLFDALSFISICFCDDEGQLSILNKRMLPVYDIDGIS